MIDSNKISKMIDALEFVKSTLLELNTSTQRRDMYHETETKTYIETSWTTTDRNTTYTETRGGHTT